MSEESNPNPYHNPNPNNLSFAPSSGVLTADWIDLDDIFSSCYFHPDLDFSSFFDDMDNLDQLAGDSSLKASSSSSSSSNNNSKSNSNTTFQDVKLKDGVILIPPSIPKNIKIEKKIQPTPNKVNKDSSQQKGSKYSKYEIEEEEEDDDDDDEDDDYDTGDRRKRKSYSSNIDPNDLTEQQKIERRERNREHAKRSRIRKKVLLDSLQDQLTALRQENLKLRRVVVDKLPNIANNILDTCTTEESKLLADDSAPVSIKIPRSISGSDLANLSAASIPNPVQHAKILMEPDFRLIHSLITSQQNFVLSDPSLPDNPIVYASDGFIKLSGYKRQDIIGRNCRFLQGPGTDQAAVDVIRQGVAEGRDISVCLLNYRADGSPFWNQFFVAALRDADGTVVNFVGVQCEVNSIPVTEIKERIKKLPLPDL